MKYIFGTVQRARKPSRPARGGWVEMLVKAGHVEPKPCPAPHGAGGLKFALQASKPANMESRPARGGWVEIASHRQRRQTRYRPAPHGAGGLKYIAFRSVAAVHGKSRPARGGWVEIAHDLPFPLCARQSRPARGGWVEIDKRRLNLPGCAVPPRTGRVG